ncbi:recombinase family protein [Vagococcus sp. BWB3-3]|uniref:Recombinase family protein n=1 Tax=Vagococcus allomyrinae TaxID=2794353 RepID=A0A940PB04_9ENTE|nr:recombinase family protein [Vagococcus allomyrinae]MBP1040131.1 recombinase family protein [Vagococcus allomyrinae]
MAIVGYTTLVDDEAEVSRLTQAGCHEVKILQDDEDNFDVFEAFVMAHQKDEIIVVSLESIGLQVTQLATVLGFIQEEGVHVHVIDKPMMSDEAYLSLLLEVAQGEIRIISRRTLKGLRLAHARGSVSGRPSITPEVVDRIQQLHQTEKRTLREIAEICNVSLGTVHKYIKLMTGS